MSAHDFALVARILQTARPSSNGWVRAPCLFCPIRVGKEDKTLAFAYNAHTGVYRCMRCGVSGKIGAAQSMVPSAVVAAAGTVDYDPNEATQPPEGFYRLDCEPALSAMACRPAYDFLEARGITSEKIHKAQMGVCLKGKYFGRIIIPVLAEDDNTWLGWIGRAWTKESKLRYLYPKGMPRGEIFYNQKALHVKTDEPLLVVEGSFDSQFEDDAAPVLGKPGWAQLAQLLDGTIERPIVFVLDGDAWKESWAHHQKMRMAAHMKGVKTRFGSLRLTPSFDPATIDWQKLKRSAREEAFR